MWSFSDDPFKGESWPFRGWKDHKLNHLILYNLGSFTCTTQVRPWKVIWTNPTILQSKTHCYPSPGALSTGLQGSSSSFLCGMRSLWDQHTIASPLVFLSVQRRGWEKLTLSSERSHGDCWKIQHMHMAYFWGWRYIFTSCGQVKYILPILDFPEIAGVQQPFGSGEVAINYLDQIHGWLSIVNVSFRRYTPWK